MEHPKNTGVGAVPPGTALLECHHYVEKGVPMPHVKIPHSHQTAAAEDAAPEQPAVLTLLGSTDDEILEFAEQVYHR